MTKRTYHVGDSTLTLEFGDLTLSAAEVLVSSDDSYITMGGGVSAAILRAGGESILIDASKKVPAELGEAIVTAAGTLRAKHVFHAITIGEDELAPREIISRATRRCMELLTVLRLHSIAFPAIGAGVAGFSYENVAAQMAEVLVDCIVRTPERKVDVTLYLHDRFGEMKTEDFVRFFEEFAVQTRGVLQNNGTLTHRMPGDQPLSPQDPVNVPERLRLLRKLGELEGERQQLERRLAECDGSIPDDEATRIEGRLKLVHQQRVDVLSRAKLKPSTTAARVFLSYSHADEALRRELGKHLSVLERQGVIATWHDRMIDAGSEWEGEIHEELERAHAILLLVSADFVNSCYCYDIEMRRALERHEYRQALVVPILLRPVVLRGMPFSKLQALPRDAKAAVEWPSLDAAFVDVTHGVRAAIESFMEAAARQGRCS